MACDNNTKVKMNALVWAQMRYCPYWPAKVVETPPEMGRTPVSKACVLFFGTKQFGFVERAKMMDYTLNREKFTKKWRGREFNEAVKQMDDFITNPIKFKSNAYAKPPGGKIRIKTEHSVEKNLNIKSEQNVDQIRQQTENATKCDASESYVQEKKRLLDTLTHLKSENQKLTFELKKKSEECAKLAQKHADCKNVIANLVHQKQSLSAQLEQLKTTAGQNNSHENITNDSNPNSSESDVYEVEQILDDKKIKNVRYFLVRWKGFSKKDDTWERKSNLMCPDILEEYEAKKREMS